MARRPRVLGCVLWLLHRLFNIADSVTSLAKALTLTGHTRGISSVSFAWDGHTLVTGSQDGWRLWDIGVRFAQGEDARLLRAQAFVEVG